MASKGIALHVIQSLARWESDVVRRYVGEAALRTLTSSCRAAVAGKAGGVDYARSRDDRVGVGVTHKAARDPGLAADLRELKELVTRVAAECDAAAKASAEAVTGELSTLRRELDAVMRDQEAMLAPKFVVNVVTRTLHSVGAFQAGGQAADWRAGCGWAFGRTGRYVFVGTPQDTRAQTTCRCAVAAVQLWSRAVTDA